MLPDYAIEQDEILEQLLSKRYVVGAPKTEKDLRVQYAEMFEFPEFHRSRLKNADDVLFVWWYACASSPYFDMPDEKKLDKCIERAYRSEARRAQKREEFKKIPDEIRAAVKRMMALNVGVRIENYVRLIRIRKNCHELLEANVSTMDDEQKDAWTKRAPGLWKMLEETQKALEKGAYGVSEADETMFEETDGALRDWRNESR